MTPNPKIQELIKSMGIIPESEHYEIAERIVLECASLFRLQFTDEQYQRRIDKTIMKHFGIE